MTPQPSDWRYLADQASKEADPAKMLTILEELNRVLEQERNCRHFARLDQDCNN